MSEITLSKAEAAILTKAAARAGALVQPESGSAAVWTRRLGRFAGAGLVAEGEAGPVLTPTGYRAIGLVPPGEPAPRVPKSALVLDLLGRGEGASLAELVAATGWLPHTTRAALSRLRSAGRSLAKFSRDGTTAYRLVAAA